jgi:transglutaminase-like putative cysteine protease
MKTRHSLVLAAEIALAAVTLAAVLGMARLFDGGGWLGPLAVNAVLAHLTASLLRRRGISLPVTALAMALAALVVIGWTTEWSTTTLGLPLGDTLGALQTDLSEAWATYKEVQAPAPVAPGFLVASAIALWCIAYVADWAAFRLWVPFEATLPAGTLFLFTALLGVERGRGWAIAVYSAALLVFLLLHRMARQDGSSHWVAERRALGHRSLLIAGSGLTAVAVLVGSIAGPSLPGASSTGVINAREIGSGDDSRVTISPLVDIKSRLIDQAATEVFTVRSTSRSYWRLTSLEQFDGEIWSSSGNYGKAGGELEDAESSDLPTETVRQTFRIESLAAIWLPSAFEARTLSVAGVEVRYDEASSTLIVDNAVDDSDGLVYQVTSESLRLTDEQLAEVSGEIPGDVADANLALPSDFSPRVANLAAEVAAGADTPAEQALALQDHLRNPANFTYSLDVQRGHSGDALETFLFDTQTGYCEQFAGSFAAMARSLGLPPRVAVGYTPGDADPEDPQVFHVRGEHAHAWPEVYLGGAGWVAFEPTPGRGAPNAEDYTGVPEQQTAPGGGTGEPVATSSTVPQDTIPSDTRPPSERPTDGNQIDPGGTGGADDAPSWGEQYVVDPLRRILPIAVGIGLAYLLLFPLGLLLWRTRRRHRARTPLERVTLAWRETAERAEPLGYLERPSDTPFERAHRLAAALPDHERQAFALARLLSVGSYSATGADDAAAEEATALSAELTAAALERTSIRTRLAHWLDPRALVAGWRRERRARQRQITMSARGDLEQERELDYSSSA